MRVFKVAAVQTHTVIGDSEGNVAKALDGLKEAAAQDAKIACLPELFNTGYIIESHHLFSQSEPIDGPVIKKLQKFAADNEMIIIAPIAERGEVTGVVYNTAVLIDEKGKVLGCARKNYRWGVEKLSYREGKGYPVFETNLGKIGILICYDAELPEPARLLALKSAELVFVPSCWSKKGETRWDIQLPARALDNLYFVVGVNIVGENNCGKSKIISPRGRVMAEAPRENEAVLTTRIGLDEVVEARREIPYYTDFRPETFYKLDQGERNDLY